MFVIQPFLFLILFYFKIVATYRNTYVDHCPSACVCTVINEINNTAASGVRALCEHSRFIRIPSASQYPDDTYELDLSSNAITKIDLFESMKNLAILDLSTNQINDIVPHAFSDLKSLLNLDLSNNQLNDFNVDTFDGLKGLKLLNLSNNLLTDLDENLFKPLTSLTELHLSSNPLVHLSSRVLKPLKSLSILALNQIDAYTLQTDIFRYNSKLSELHLSANKFIKVPNDGLRSAVNLRKLIFNRNPIREINWESFIGLSTLEMLSVSYSPSLSDIHKDSFSDLSNLRTLSITWNNVLTYMDPLAFHGMYNSTCFRLTEVYLNDNRLSSLDAASLLWCGLKVLDLSGNEWRCDCYLRWIMECPNNGKFLVPGVRCKAPLNLRGIEFQRLNPSSFVCAHRWNRL